MLRSGKGKTNQICYVNRNRQKCLGHRGRKSCNHCGQTVYKLECLCCGHVYGANGCDVHLRRCPNPECQGGKGDDLQW